MRQRLALFVPALALAAAGSLPLATVLSSSPALASSHKEGSTTAAAEGTNANRAVLDRDDRAIAEQASDKGEHLDLTCWDRDRPMTASPVSATGASATTTSPGTGMIECTWNPATRSDFGGYKLVRTSDVPSTSATSSTSSTAKVAEAGPKAATNPTLMMAFQSTSRSADQFVDTNVTVNVEYTYQLEVLDSHGNIAVRSEPQTVTDRAPATTTTTAATVDHLDLDCRTPTRADGHDRVMTVCTWSRVDNAAFFSFRLTRQVAGGNQAPTLIFLTTNRSQTSFTDTTVVHGVDYVYRIEELNLSGNVIGQSNLLPAHSDPIADLPRTDGRSVSAR